MARVLNLDKDLLSPLETQVRGKVSKIFLKWNHASGKLTGFKFSEPGTKPTQLNPFPII